MSDLADRYVSRETQATLRLYADIVIDEGQRQNLIARSTVDDIWQRHVIDSLQLLKLAPNGEGTWLDIGSGAGFPGMVVAIARPANQVIMIEPRARRVDFLIATAARLGVTNVDVIKGKVGQTPSPPPVIITARAVASLSDR